MKIGLFGGSFNPVHTGHVALARQLLQTLALDEVWLMLSPQNPLKPAGSLLSDHIRLEQLQAALQGETGLKACDYELHLPLPSYTWQTLQQLEQDYPQHQFTLLIGADNWVIFHKWFRSDDILRRYPIAIYPRPGIELESSQLPEHVRLIDATLLDISSTAIRQRIALGQSISGMVAPAVEQLIERYSLYRD